MGANIAHLKISFLLQQGASSATSIGGGGGESDGFFPRGSPPMHHLHISILDDLWGDEMGGARSRLEFRWWFSRWILKAFGIFLGFHPPTSESLA